MAKHHPTPSAQDVRDMIRETGLRCTNSRVVVLQRMIEATSPLSHADLAEELVPIGFDQATVYRNLTDLTDAGLLTRLELGDHVWRFEFRRDDAHADGEHPHFVCTDCGRISCLPDVNVNITQSGKGDLVVGEICEVFLKGRCESCT